MSEEVTKIGTKPSAPGEFVRYEILEELGLSVAKAAEILGVRRATLSDLVNGHAALSPEMALRIEKAFGVDMDMLLRMQADVSERYAAALAGAQVNHGLLALLQRCSRTQLLRAVTAEARRQQARAQMPLFHQNAEM